MGETMERLSKRYSSVEISTSFKTTRINDTTFLVVEDDTYLEHPFIYVKLHPTAPVIILSDTGCDEPSDRWKHENFVHLRLYLEHFPVVANNHKPINPGSQREYIIICTHCHYDHTGGIAQFLRGGTTNIIASAAGRDFIESDLGSHGLFKYVGRPTPYYQVTRWAGSLERLKWPLPNLNYPDRKPGGLDLGITILQTPGHTPDELAWYDHEEMHLFVGDSFYEEGQDGMPILWPPDGNFVEWLYSMQKLLAFAQGENAKAQTLADQYAADGDWVAVARRVKVGCGHQTSVSDAEQMIGKVLQLFWKIVRGQVPVIRSFYKQHELVNTWRERGEDVDMSFEAPDRLMDEARKFFDISLK